MRNRVTIYLSEQDIGGDYYPRIERIEDSFGNAFTYTQGNDFSGPLSVQTATTLRVGDTVTFRCTGTDPQGRALTWFLRLAPPGEPAQIQGNQADLTWNVRYSDTGPKKWVGVYLTHEGSYHRNVMGNLHMDAIVLFYYCVLPPL